MFRLATILALIAFTQSAEATDMRIERSLAQCAAYQLIEISSYSPQGVLVSLEYDVADTHSLERVPATKTIYQDADAFEAVLNSETDLFIQKSSEIGPDFKRQDVYLFRIRSWGTDSPTQRCVTLVQK